jgi:hypothetical protein
MPALVIGLEQIDLEREGELVPLEVDLVAGPWKMQPDSRTEL